jgi:tRNA (guanine37-N1)-methyltransferase
MRYQIISIFPELIDAALKLGLLGKAIEARLIETHVLSPRGFATNKHQSVDDAPYGGGSGMVMTPEPIAKAIEFCDAQADAEQKPRAHRILLTPQGEPFTQVGASRLAQQPALMLICGRYEGIDERIRGFVHEELSLGDFVLNGGEVAALAIIEATARLVPGVLGNEGSLLEESHGVAGLLEYPHYTRPRTFRGHAVPEILLSGNHAEIARWRRQQSLARTRSRRPDLFARLNLSTEDRALLAELDREQKP